MKLIQPLHLSLRSPLPPPPLKQKQTRRPTKPHTRSTVTFISWREGERSPSSHSPTLTFALPFAFLAAPYQWPPLHPLPRHSLAHLRTALRLKQQVGQQQKGYRDSRPDPFLCRLRPGSCLASTVNMTTLASPSPLSMSSELAATAQSECPNAIITASGLMGPETPTAVILETPMILERSTSGVQIKAESMLSPEMQIKVLLRDQKELQQKQHQPPPQLPQPASGDAVSSAVQDLAYLQEKQLEIVQAYLRAQHKASQRTPMFVTVPSGRAPYQFFKCLDPHNGPLITLIVAVSGSSSL